MSSAPPDLVVLEDDDTSQVATPLLTQMHSSPVHPTSISPDASFSDQAKSDSSSLLSPNSSHLRLPIPTPSANRSQSSFAFVDVHEDDNGGDFDDLPQEVASADISIAPDGSFVETPSAQAARELKKRYDRLFGVGKSRRSPYAITAFVNQHGKQMYRVGHRDQSAPAAAGAEVEHRTTLQIEQNVAQQQQQAAQYKKSMHSTRSDRHSSRRSRMSMHAFLPPSMFPVVSSRHGDDALRVSANDSMRSPGRKLRKARSNPQLPGESSSSAPSSQSAAPAGRGHSQSVTAADIPRLPAALLDPISPSRGDMFSTVMQWNSMPPSPVASRSMSFSKQSLSLPAGAPDTPRSLATIVNPFGARVMFDSPSRPTDPQATTPLLREMQSFESGLTARADPQLRMPRTSVIPSMAFFSSAPAPNERPEDQDEPPETAPPTPEPSPAPFTPRPQPEDRSFLPSDETSLHTRYSMEVFDVLQTYRGLPLLDKLSPDSTETTVIKMSLNADDTAAPRDDPRFVIWGEVYPEPTEVVLPPSTESSSRPSKRRSTNGSQPQQEDHPRMNVQTVVGEPEKVLVAATIERWIAQLTSEFNYDELLVFFLTYRTYISAVDLCHLLICRFHWALGQPSSDNDERVRRIVRVRTFVAIRYWLLTFFVVDFVPNRELRLLLASWLNSLRRDPILQKHTDAPSIVRKLVSVVRECKEVHTQRGRQSTSVDKRILGTGTSLDGPPRKSLGANDSDVDLDFIAEGNAASLIGTGGFYGAATTGVVTGIDGNKVASLAVLQQPLHKAIMEHRPSISTAATAPVAQTPASLPAHHNALSRAFVNTIGRLGRWKRVLNSRSTAVPTPLAACTDVSAFDLELNATGDLLTVRGGVEQYLKVIEQPALAALPVPVPAPGDQETVPASQDKVGSPQPTSSPPSVVQTGADGDGTAPETVLFDEVPDASEEIAEVEHDTHAISPVPVDVEQLSSPPPVQISLRSNSRSRSSSGSSGSSSSYGALITSGAFHPRPPQERSWQIDVVSIDDLEFSDTSSNGSAGPAAPPGLKKLPRRLPLRRDFEFVDRPTTDSVSSMGLTSHESMSGPSSSAASSQSVGGLGSTIQQWQVNALVDSLSDEEGGGDVEDALRRLEGQMNPQTQRAKESKVDNWVKTIRERLEAGDYGNEAPRYPSDDDEGMSDLDPDHHASTAWSRDDASSIASVLHRNSQSSSRLVPSADVLASDSTTPIAAKTPYHAPIPASHDTKPAVEDVVPPEILESRMSGPVSPARSPTSPSAPPPTHSPPLSKFVNPKYSRAHRSWILSHGAGELAQHFSMIDRELFLGVKFEELVSDDWISSVDEANILDWGLFLKDRARWKAEGRSGYKTSALVAARGRFNLVANFVLSEIVLTFPAERPALVGKFIRIAWKCYNLNNFTTLVAIIAGLRSEWVTRVMRKSWNRVNVYNLRMLKDLTAFTSSEHDFAHIRNAVAMLSDAPPGAASEEAASVRSSAKGKPSTETKSSAPAPCIPFLGIYLSQLRRFSELPDLIDPTAPNEAVGVDPATGNFNAPAHAEVFSILAPLPPAMQLEPLINVHKQRLIAGAIKELVAGQHLASRVQFPIDRKLFQRCLKLRGLDEDTLQRVFAMHPS